LNKSIAYKNLSIKKLFNKNKPPNKFNPIPEAKKVSITFLLKQIYISFKKIVLEEKKAEKINLK
jgi:hypothetical protein